MRGSACHLLTRHDGSVKDDDAKTWCRQRTDKTSDLGSDDYGAVTAYARAAVLAVHIFLSFVTKQRVQMCDRRVAV